MGKYIKKFDTHSDYEDFIETEDFIRPNVSYCVDNVEVHYNPDPYNGHEYVEIAGIKWATMNIGANSVTDTGLYFQWGDNQGYTAAQVGSGEGQKYFGWADYKYSNDDGSVMTKYNETDGKTILEAADDAARANWGGSWRMPTKDDYVALGNAINMEWTADYQGSGIAGILCTDETDSSKTLFFPAAGFCRNGEIKKVGVSGYHLSSSLNTDRLFAYLLFFNSSNTYWDEIIYRYFGFSVRPVAD